MKNNPLVSIIIPVYNAEKFLVESINSVLHQTYENLEVIVVNDGSTDGSLDILSSLTQADTRILVINKPNSGIVDSLNIALEKCTGKYIVRMDADDICIPERINKQVSFMERNINVDLSGTYVKFFGEDIPDRIVKYPLSHRMIKEKLMYAAPFCHPTLIIRHSSIKKFNIRYEHGYIHAEDYALYVKHSKDLTYANIPEVLLKYRIATNITYIADKNIIERKEVLSKIQSLEVRNELNYSFNESEKTTWFNYTRLELKQYSKSDLRKFIDLLTKLKHSNLASKHKDLFGFLYLRYIIWVFIKHKWFPVFSLHLFSGFRYLCLYWLRNRN